tara:strand:- start:259 stop:468 length:210 start_codon:yes stop_codon:yes gene_type:complete
MTCYCGWEGEDHDGCLCFLKESKSKMPKHIKIYISNDKYGHHGNGTRDKEFWSWWDGLSDQEKEQEIGK